MIFNKWDKVASVKESDASLDFNVLTNEESKQNSISFITFLDFLKS